MNRRTCEPAVVAAPGRMGVATMAASSAVQPERSDQTDEDIVRQVLAGNTAMFELLMRRYNQRVYRAARSIVRDEGEAEDVMQHAYVKAYTHLWQFNGSARFSTWLLRIAINESLTRVRHRSRIEAIEEEMLDTGSPASGGRSDPEQQTIAGELRLLLEEAIDTLPDGMREVFVLREVEGLSTSDVAASLDVSEDVVKTRLSRSRVALRRVLLDRTGISLADVFRFFRPRCDRVVEAVLRRIMLRQSN
jgi:RNA polymerase sigma-70 factor, ECF subfamily